MGRNVDILTVLTMCESKLDEVIKEARSCQEALPKRMTLQ
jgi:hypothetical protein